MLLPQAARNRVQDRGEFHVRHDCIVYFEQNLRAFANSGLFRSNLAFAILRKAQSS